MNKNVKLNLMSKTKINISDSQLGFLFDKFQKISYLESKIENANLLISPNVLVMGLLEREGVDSSIIEGTQTNHDEMYYDVSEGIRDVYSWEVRNLINLYKNSFRDFKDGILDYSIDDLKALHRKLFSRNIEGYMNMFDPIEIIKKIKPGKLLEDDSKPNWIGPRGKSIESASLILIKPSEKKKYLEDIFEEIRNNKNKRSIATLIKFHPFFEAIHPFSDGNGRLGRMLLVNLMSYLGFSKYNWIFISDYWKQNKDEYIKELRKVQTTNKWNDWIYFFVGSLSETVDISYRKLNMILDMYKKIDKSRFSDVDKRILRYFFQYPILNRKKTIDGLKNKYKVPNTTAYRSFEKIAKLIEAISGENYRFKKMLDILSS
ncbi:MAG: Fic family protein [Mycoplasmatales bacterium]|nr:Fic family protein [Mycoplasmatales bacterium]